MDSTYNRKTQQNATLTGQEIQGYVQLDDDVVNSQETFISSVHASRTFVIPPQSEILVPGKLEEKPASVVSINGMLAPRANL